MSSPHGDGGLYRVAADGGSPAELTTLDPARQEIPHRWPRFLPDGRHVLFLNRVATAQLNRYTISAVPTTGGGVTPLLDAKSTGVYDGGRLLFMRDEQLFQQPFDPVALKLSGAPELVENAVWTDGQGMAGLVGFDVAAGLLGWRPAISRRTLMRWKDRYGKILEAVQGVDAGAGVPSHDGRLIMLTRPDHQMNTVTHAILDRERGVITPFSAPDTTSTAPVWSPDDRRVVYSLLRDGAYDLYVKDVRPEPRTACCCTHRDESGAELVARRQDHPVQRRERAVAGRPLGHGANPGRNAEDLHRRRRRSVLRQVFAGRPVDCVCVDRIRPPRGVRQVPSWRD